MAPETFAAAHDRVFEFRAGLKYDADRANLRVSFCGLGEPLLHPQLGDWIRRFTECDIGVSLSTNASRLDEGRAQELLDAGLDMIHVNFGAEGGEYETIYGLSYQETRRNLDRFIALAAGRCRVRVAVVDYHDTPDTANRLSQAWLDRGVASYVFKLINRSGSLVADTRLEALDRRHHVRACTRLTALIGDQPACAVPFRFYFIGWDGCYYLCSSDWEKRSVHGSVFDHSLAEASVSKLVTVRSRSPICVSCTHDPINRLATAFDAGAEQPEIAALERELVTANASDTTLQRHILPAS
jgi:MoaA/NifB/PqqE/SkfB family radical SAM enzyme